ncbi:MAG TPA: XrtA/PEP-CTERM system-associated ATPase [Candidatus Limnocylindrales bacterium]|nr:XrtA/PEP-CTERM system-associated ATPase [Candidatus Limnocylindrales bacterium]
MYNQFYGFKEKPFKLTPDPDFFYHSSVHRQALAYLTYGLEDKQGFIALTGEVGSGKTTVIQVLLNSLKDTTKVAKINNTNDLTSLQLLEMIVRDFGLTIKGGSKTELLESLNRFLLEQHALGNYALLIVDEAQNFTTALLEEIRLLSNLETSKEKLLQIILSGQPELAHKLRQPELRQLAQRITVTFHMTGLDRKETEGYIHYRLQVAGCQNKNLFTSEAIDHIAEFSRGIPRMINNICDAALLTGFVSEKRQIDEAIVLEVIEELKAVQSPLKETRELSTSNTPKYSPEPSGESVKTGLEALPVTSLLEKKLEELGSKLESVQRAVEKIEQTHRLEPAPETESLQEQRNLSKTPWTWKDDLGEDELIDLEAREKTPVREDISMTDRMPRIAQELITNSAHFPLFALLLKTNVYGFPEYLKNRANLVMWIGTLAQAWFLGSSDRPLHKFLGNFISPFIYSGVGIILQGLSFIQRAESLIFWIYSVINGFLQALRIQVGKEGQKVVKFFEILLRLALIPAFYIFYEVERRRGSITWSALQEFFAEQNSLTEAFKRFQEVVMELFKDPISAYLIEALFILGVLYGLNKVLKAQKQI